MAASTPACQVSWLGGSGAWVSSNWSGGSPPVGNQVACITIAGSSVTVQQAAVDAGAIVLGGSSGAAVTLTVVGSDTVASQVGVSAASVIDPTGVLSLASASDAKSDNAQFNVEDQATLTNEGTIETSGHSAILDGSVTNEASGKVEMNGDTSNNNGDLVNDGAWSIGGGATAYLNVSSFSQMSGTLNDHGTLEFTGTTFKMLGGRETGNAVQLDAPDTLDDKAGTASFDLVGGNTLAGVIPAGQTVTCLVPTASAPGTTDLASPGVTVKGALIVDDAVAGVNDELTGRLTNDKLVEIKAKEPASASTPAPSRTTPARRSRPQAPVS